MLLKLLYDFALSKNLLEDDAFVLKPVRWIIQLDNDGQLIADGLVETVVKEKEFSIPKTTRATGGGQVSDFLVDDIGALFNLNMKPDKKLNQRSMNNLRGKHQDFWRQIDEAFIATKYSAFASLLNFHAKLQDDPPEFLKLTSTGTTKWMINKSDGSEVKLGSDLFTFAVGGEILINDESIVRPYWRQIHAKEVIESVNSAPKGLCIITGQVNVPIARTHTPMVTGLPKPAKGTGAGLVGFEGRSFCSYGFKQSLNAPVSIEVSKAYLAAIQYLSKQKDHWLAIGPAWLCFWAMETEAVSSCFARILRQPDSKTVKEFMVTPWKGFEQSPNKLERFVAITFSAAGPRLVVKDWLQLTVQEAEKNFKVWFTDLEIIFYGGYADSQDEKTPLSIDHLACTTIRRKSDGRFDRDQLNPDLVAALYRAALKRESPPVTLLKPILDRLKANIAKNGLKSMYDQSRFALLRLILNRNRKEGEPMIEAKVFETSDPAYNCGRLLAIFDDLQMQAHSYKLEGAGVVERYYGSASSAPNSAFGILWRLHQHHLRKISQKGDKGKQAAYSITQRIAGIAALFPQPGPKLPPQFPRTFNLQEQGRFALGFYQQMAERRANIDEYLRKKKLGELKPEEINHELELAENEATSPSTLGQ
ncbi:MAG: type I-C CRISPR-associated protein Cas8c/Csd1 [Methylococcaceae bacterium]